MPAIDMESLAVYTNNPPCGAMRGFGANQAAFAIEGLLDRLAEKVGIDALRHPRSEHSGARRSLRHRPDPRQAIRPAKDARGSPRSIQVCQVRGHRLRHQERRHWQRHADIGRAALSVEDDATVHIRTGFTEMGQGLFTLCIQFAVEATGLPPDQFKCPPTPPAAQLRSNHRQPRHGLAGNAIAEAGKGAESGARPGRSLRICGPDFHGEWICDYTSKLGKDIDKPGGPKTHLTYGFATQVAISTKTGDSER